LAAIVHGDREIKAIDVFRLRDSSADVDVTTRSAQEVTTAGLDAAQVHTLTQHRAVLRELPEHDGVSGWRLSMPLTPSGAARGGRRGAAERGRAPPLRPPLPRRIRWIDGAVLVASIVLISAVLTIFLERRVARPVDTLVDGMRRVERGDLSVRVQPFTEGEF